MKKAKLTLSEINKILECPKLTQATLQLFKSKTYRSGALIEKYLSGISLKEIGEHWQMTPGGTQAALGRAVQEFQKFSDTISNYISTFLKIEEMKINPERLIEAFDALQKENLILKEKYSITLSVFPVDQLSLLDQTGITESDVVLAKSRRIPIKELDLSVGLINCLTQSGVIHLGDIEKYTMEEIRKVRNVGQTLFAQLEAVMKQYGVSFRKES